MRRPVAITLALLGSGSVAALVLGGVGRGDSAACRQARLDNRPDVASVCGSSSGRSSGHGGGAASSSGGSGDSGAGSSSVSRGGFGAAGHAAGS